MACLPRLRGVPILDSNPVAMTQYERWRSEIRKSLEANIGDGVKRAARQHGYESYDCQIVVDFRRHGRPHMIELTLYCIAALTGIVLIAMLALPIEWSGE